MQPSELHRTLQDEENVTLMLDNGMTEEFKTLRDFYNLPAVGKPYSIAKFLNLGAPANTIMCNYLSDSTREEGEDTIVSRMRFMKG